ncbi:hypothetical protein PY650_03625 [Rhizobium calliandrae]|uniref:Lipoprotein n=1 Tax=Rhizobium calliandrae TaxID=1312182 RepID=A0ABT7K821_9HYPH|nr:hypothetical protein [Rhizobium calliandrae]MDL2404761.1 hypothetical protein [Rhizobium calliandrae]
MLIKAIFSAVFFALISLSISACSTTGQGNSSGMTHSSPAGGGTSGGGGMGGGGMGGGY